MRRFVYNAKRRIIVVIVFYLFLSSSVWAQPAQVFFSPQGGCTRAVVAQLSKAQRALDIAMYSLTSEEIAQEILRAKQKGVTVRIIVDKVQSAQEASKARVLKAQGVDVRIYQSRGLMHNKFAIIDRKVLITGSFNWTQNAEEDNAENLLILGDPSLIASYAKEFGYLWARGSDEEGRQDLETTVRKIFRQLKRLLKDILKKCQKFFSERR